jgi:signal transduction histidine kinase
MIAHPDMPTQIIDAEGLARQRNTLILIFTVVVLQFILLIWHATVTNEFVDLIHLANEDARLTGRTVFTAAQINRDPESLSGPHPELKGLATELRASHGELVLRTFANSSLPIPAELKELYHAAGGIEEKSTAFFDLADSIADGVATPEQVSALIVTSDPLIGDMARAVSLYTTANRKVSVQTMIGQCAALALWALSLWLLWHRLQRDRRRLSQAINDRNADLDSVKQGFVRTLSHQMRTPLNAIRWNLETVLSDPAEKISDNGVLAIRQSLDASRETIATVHDLMAMADIEEGRLTVRPADVSLVDITKSVLTELDKLAAAKNLRLCFEEPPKPLPLIHADVALTKAAIMHVVRNAIWYTPSAGKIDVSIEPRTGHARLTVKDTGIGIPGSELNNVFEKFYRASNASTMIPDASGIGLAVSKFYVERQGGKIGLSNNGTGGVTAWIEMPYSLT